MLKPKKMTQAVIVGSKEHLEETIEALHKLNAIHINNFTEERAEFKIGHPLKRAASASEKLLKIRSISNFLGIGDMDISEKFKSEELFERMDTELSELEQRVNNTVEKREQIEKKLENVKKILEQIKPVMEDTTLNKIYVKYDVREILSMIVTKEIEEKIVKILQSEDLTTAKIDHSILFSKMREVCEKLEEEKEKEEKELDDIKVKYAPFILASDELLSIEVEKVEAPLRFAVTDHFFVIDCFVLTERIGEVKKRLDKVHESISIERLEGDDEKPVILDNPKPVKPFEFMTNLFSTPKYKEVDPTLILSIFFSIFFGFIIGDLGYGILVIILGLYLRKKYIFGIGGRGVGNPLLIGGIFASIFGALVFSEAFGFCLPHHPMIHKLEIEGVIELFVLSIVAAFLHLGIGFVIGFFNNVRRNKKHAIAKIGWLFTLFAIFLLLMLMAEGTQVGGWVCTNILFSIQKNSIDVGGLLVPVFSLYFLVIGLITLIVFEGVFAVMEILSLVGNTVSYLRLAAVGVAKAATALAFNSMFLPMIVGGNMIYVVIGVLLLVMMHVIVFILGIISAGIQGLRLNYVEFFLKFYEGGGTKFKPFGYRRRYTRA
jgi:V/A-type H+-transporting ATPase subunit I